MKIKILILSVAVFLLSIFLLIRYYTNAEENSINEKIAQAEALIKSGETTTALYDTVYSTFKHRGEVKQKYIKYSFEVKDKSFDDEMTINELPAARTFTIVYLPSDPMIHSQDPKGDLDTFNRRKKDKSTSVLPWSLLLGSILIFYLTRRSHLNDIAEAKELDDILNQSKK